MGELTDDWMNIYSSVHGGVIFVILPSYFFEGAGFDSVPSLLFC